MRLRLPLLHECTVGELHEGWKAATLRYGGLGYLEIKTPSIRIFTVSLATHQSSSYKQMFLSNDRYFTLSSVTAALTVQASVASNNDRGAARGIPRLFMRMQSGKRANAHGGCECVCFAFRSPWHGRLHLAMALVDDTTAHALDRIVRERYN